MRNFTLIILTILYAFPVFAQRKCGTETAVLQKIQDNPGLLKLRTQIDSRIREATLQLKQHKTQLKTTYNTVTIPVVVHIVLRNPALVTDAQIYSQIDILNKDYTATNTDMSLLPSAWQPLIGNSGIQFCLAQRNPDDNPTNGIDRVTTTRTSFSFNNAGSTVKSTTTGGANPWNTDNYLNIWVCDLSDGYLGVATIPGFYSPDQAGVVIDYQAFGNQGSAVAPYNKGRTVVHEIGHFFTLRHIWGDEPYCNVDDDIDDTPKQGTNTYGCPAFPKFDTCQKAPSPGIMFNNYMDYSDDACMYLFTSDQVDRMRISLNADHAGLLSSNACTPLNLLNVDAQILQILSPSGQLCANSITPVVILKNQGLTTLTSVQVNYQTDDGTPHTFNWTGNLTALKTDTLSLAETTPGEGPNLLKVYTSQPNGEPDEDPTNDTATAPFQYYPDGTFPISEGFEGNTFPPVGWEIKNYDNSYTWELTTDAAKSGSSSIVMRNHAYDINNERDDLLLPLLDPTGKDSVFLFFDVAAASFSGADSREVLWDSLLVMTTSDCGVTFDSAYKKGGPDFLTHKQGVDGEFIPTAAEWRRDSVNLTPFVKKGKFRVVFRNISNAENNVYLDNINLITKSTLPYLKEQGYTVGPVPVVDQLYITFLEAPSNLNYIAIYNTIGQQVAKQAGSSVNTSNRFIFDLVNEPNGIYFVKLIYRNSVKTIKITKVR